MLGGKGEGSCEGSCVVCSAFVADERWNEEKAAPVTVEFASGLEDATFITSMYANGMCDEGAALSLLKTDQLGG
jgi:hypothetical protein